MSLDQSTHPSTDLQEGGPPPPAVTPYITRPFLQADLPSFRALHDTSLQVTYDTAFYNTVCQGVDTHGSKVLSFVAMGGEGEEERMLGGLSVRLFAPSGYPHGEGGDSASYREQGEEWLRGASQWMSRVLSGMRWVCGGGRGWGSKDPLLVGVNPPQPPPLQDSAYVMTLCVAQCARRRGVARALLQALITHLTALHVHAISLHMLVGNEPAENLYRSFGFIPKDALLEKYYYFNGEYHSAILWEKILCHEESVV